MEDTSTSPTTAAATPRITVIDPDGKVCSKAGQIRRNSGNVVNAAHVSAVRLPYLHNPDAVAKARAYPERMADELFKKQRRKEPNSYQAQEAAKHANMLRLRAERLAREAANRPQEEPATKPEN